MERCGCAGICQKGEGKLEGIEKDLSKYSLVALDTSVFIYHFEKSEAYFNLTKEIFSRPDDEDLEFSAVTSIITFLEISVKLIKEARNDILERYSTKFLYDEKLTTFFLDESIALKAAELRSKYGIKTPDAIQLATGIIGRTDTFITNDKSLRKVGECTVLVLDDYL